MYCTQCGKQLAEGARFCPYCGKSMQPGGPQPQPTTPDVPQPTTPAAPAASNLPQPTQGSVGPAVSGSQAGPGVPPSAPSSFTPSTPVPPTATASVPPTAEKKKGCSGGTCFIVGCLVLVLGLIAVGVVGYVLMKRVPADPEAGVLGAIIAMLQSGSQDGTQGDATVDDTTGQQPGDQSAADDATSGDESQMMDPEDPSTSTEEAPGPLTEEGGAKVLHRFLKAMGQFDTNQMRKLVAHDGVIPFDPELLGQGDAVTQSYDVVEHRRVSDQKHTYVVNENLKDYEGIEFTQVWHFTLEYVSNDWVITQITIDS